MSKNPQITVDLRSPQFAVVTRAPSVHPLRDSLLTTLAICLSAAVIVGVLWIRAREAVGRQVKSGLIRTAECAAAAVDGDLHEKVRREGAEDAPDYRHAVAVLGEIRRVTPDLAFIYTVARQGDDIVFVLDPTPLGDADGDGVEDHSGLRDVYEDYEPEMKTALDLGIAVTSSQPYHDRWGSFVSGYAPIYDSQGNQVGAVGVDLKAADYQRELSEIDRAALASFAVGLALAAALGVFVFMLRRRAQAVYAQRDETLRQLELHTRTLESVNAELQTARDDALRAQRIKSDFLANMSHEIRTPLAAVLGFAELLWMEGDIEKAPPRRVEAINTIRRNGEHLAQLINDILDLSKIEAGKIALSLGPCNYRQIIHESLKMLSGKAEAKGLSLKAQFVGPVPETIITDSVRLRQILLNLVGNAIKFTELGGVRVVASVLGPESKRPQLQLEVHDTGIGMTTEEASRLFSPFMQANNSTTRKYGGTGLGLTISRRLAEMLGGSISLRSFPGAGSTFTVVVDTGILKGVEWLSPAQAAASSEPPPEKRLDKPVSQSISPKRLANRRLLLVEDGPDNQRLISTVLRKAGAEVSVAENGQLGIDAYQAQLATGQPFDLILMDMQMPVLDGYSAAGRLRQMGCTTPIVALTAHAMSEDRDKCLAAGCTDYTTKPINIPGLVELVASYTQPEPCCE